MRGNRGLYLWVLGLCSCTAGLENTAHIERDVRTRIEHRTGAEVGDGTADWQKRAEAECRPWLREPLTEERAVRVALIRNASVHASFARLGIARADLVQAGLIANPILDLNAKFFRFGSEVEVGLAQPFLDLLLRPRRRAQADADLRASEARIVEEMVALVYSVRRAFAKQRAAQSAFEVASHLVRAAQSSREVMDSLAAAGNVIKPQQTEQEIVQSRAQLSMARAEAQQIEAREDLTHLLGLFGEDAAWTLAPASGERRFEPGDLSQAEARAVAASLLLEQRYAQIDAVAQRSGMGATEAIFGGRSIGLAAKREVEAGWGFGPAGSLALPIFDSGDVRDEAAEAALRVELAELTQDAVEVRSTARRLRERWISRSRELRYRNAVLQPLHTQLVRDVLTHYNAMQVGPFDVFSARIRELRAQAELLDAAYEADLARLDLEELFAGHAPREMQEEWRPSMFLAMSGE
ncbi:MAG: TolC family protein [Planctomycetes bacterium]|nr:TolC family protein [Planctomycetota bacterium]